MIMQNNIPILPLNTVVAYPHQILPLAITRDFSLRAIDASLKGCQQMLLIPQVDARERFLEVESFNKLGVLCDIFHLMKYGSKEEVKLYVRGLKRVEVGEIIKTADDYFVGNKIVSVRENNASFTQPHSLCDTVTRRYVEHFQKFNQQKGIPKDMAADLRRIGGQNPGDLADFMASNLEKMSISKKIDILNELDCLKRLELVATYFTEEEEIAEIEKTLAAKVKKQIDENNHRYYLNEKIKAAQDELSKLSGDDSEDEYKKLEAQIKEAQMSEEAEKKAMDELGRLKQMNDSSSEANVIRNYLDWLIKFPWQKESKADYNLETAEKVLNEDHYGLEKVKERILEYLAVQIRNPDNKSPILCLVGPPGVGKTSLGKSIARAMGREFTRLALGGVRDDAEIRGHRRTYVASAPGSMVNRLVSTKTRNPVFLLDEIDKVSNDAIHGDPSSALLEVLDPAQNHAFRDHYFDLDLDFSKVFFIATANTMNIQPALLDRMEVVELSGYTPLEKKAIAKNYLIPRQKTDNAVKDEELTFTDEALDEIIEKYTAESGVRGLERQIGKIARKVVRKIDSSNKELLSVEIKNPQLEEFLGVPRYQRSATDLEAKVGVVNGLAWTAVGGTTLEVESLVFSGKGGIKNTGSLGDVMKESIQIALSVVRRKLDEVSYNLDISTCDIHIHFPEGATPKDGPSAGITISTALYSALTGKKVRGDIAMTGEINLRGQVLAIGGLKEKLLAAERNKIKTVLIPKDNEKDLKEVPEEITKNLEIIAVSSIDEVFNHSFLDDWTKFEGEKFNSENISDEYGEIVKPQKFKEKIKNVFK